MRRALVGLALVLAGSSASRAHAQAWRRPRSPVRGFASAPAAPPPSIAIEPHRPRAAVTLSGSLDGPVTIDGHGQAIFLTADGVLAKLAPDGNLRWSLLVGPPGGEPAIGADGTSTPPAATSGSTRSPRTAGCAGRAG